MSKISIQSAVKKYGDVTIIPNLNLEIKDGEFFTLLGPSGCGKTTLLRMIAGFNSIEGGNFYFNEERINDKDPSTRNIGMVFQNYAIFPHLTVRQNVEFGLKQRKLPKEEIKKYTDKFLKLMKIDTYQDRMPERLSGGQQQRVALARALAIMPDVLLMDEPLSNLDAKLRVEMREAIRAIQEEVGITTVYVTHDQEEAMAVSDRIAIMKEGVIQHIGTPKEIYHRPNNVFVATFIGRTNILEAHVQTIGNETMLKINDDNWIPITLAKIIPDQEVKVSIRPEEFEFTTEPNGIPTAIEDSIFLGLYTHYHCRLKDGTQVEVVRESDLKENIQKGSIVHLSIKTHKINVYDTTGEINYTLGNEA
ncbi:MAG: ABC transporter ATP-binding protein [Faecalicoccus sp.]|uniref:ABC transporter ATP-binding protein n=1 Tax=Faecalicoccus sp. TaxID=1971758 RepID=UPI0025D16CA2|nr:ABC transporter ATP-binding protein [Faecalicoccus sp.]MCI6378942.1 ABC transporter ATP-binding protein [Erysipelotrichaceae bacterium]MDY4869261.1 ABC transporter ATP-binding protein [Faecalicoccus sp.]